MAKLLQIYFCFTLLIASYCTSNKKKKNLPPITDQNKQKQNEPSSITIESTGAHAVVCIGSNNTIHIGTIDEKDEKVQAKIEINPLNNTNLNNKSRTTNSNNKTTIIPLEEPIKITSTNPDGTVVIGLNNTIYRHTQKQQQPTLNNANSDNSNESNNNNSSDVNNGNTNDINSNNSNEKKNENENKNNKSNENK
ncbi:hypothetical protein, partial [Candidatus Cardinium sp. cBcalN1]|uniref:hypothetical protein n=1 Tax=Candidatus Cardinium sp. cBcalN1 TaxID=2699437 RepID=UPI001FB28C0A